MPKPLTCYVCYNDDEPGSAKLEHAVNAHMGAVLSSPAEPSGATGLQVSMPGGGVFLLSIPGPYPAHELTDDLAQRQAWPTWQADSKAWRSHLIATVIPPGDGFPKRRERAADLLQVVSVVASHTGAAGIGWSPTMLFHPTAELAASIARSPVPVDCVIRCLWRGQPGPGGEGMGTTTFGLAAFGLPEIDHPPTGEDPATIYNRMMNLCSYMMENGPVLKDGDTIGIDANASMRIRHDRDPQGELLLSLHPVRA